MKFVERWVKVVKITKTLEFDENDVKTGLVLYLKDYYGIRVLPEDLKFSIEDSSTGDGYGHYHDFKPARIKSVTINFKD
jgi:hypothetical protein